MADRLRLGLIFGGRSVEHEVSVNSAQHFIAAADRARFEVVPIGVTKDGAWLTPAQTQHNLDREDPPFKKTLLPLEDPLASSVRGRRRPAEAPTDSVPAEKLRDSSLRVENRAGAAAAGSLTAALDALQDLDAVFPLIHGTGGEDGTLQGLLELAGLPYAGCGVAASAIGMDKALMKAVFAGSGLPVAEHVVVRTAGDPSFLSAVRGVEDRLGYPCFVKPANGGSSVGVSKCRGREDLVLALSDAARLDRKLVVEKAIDGREVEVAVLGNDAPEASPVGEIRHRRDFYDYEAKYLDPATELLIPADLPAGVADRARDLALRAFRAVDAAGMSRVDFFLCPDGSLVIDEINTIPGFTPASMYPRLWQAAGIGYSSLITRLVDLALARHKERPVV